MRPPLQQQRRHSFRTTMEGMWTQEVQTAGNSGSTQALMNHELVQVQASAGVMNQLQSQMHRRAGRELSIKARVAQEFLLQFRPAVRRGILMKITLWGRSTCEPHRRRIISTITIGKLRQTEEFTSTEKPRRENRLFFRATSLFWMETRMLMELRWEKNELSAKVRKIHMTKKYLLIF